MSEKPFSGAPSSPETETTAIKIKRLGEGVSSGYENELTFSPEQVIAIIQEMVIEAGDIKPTDQTFSHEGVLVSMYMRAKGSETGYSYTLKGNHGPRNKSTVTEIDRVFYDAPDSDDEVGGEIIAEFHDAAWIKNA